MSFVRSGCKGIGAALTDIFSGSFWDASGWDAGTAILMEALVISTEALKSVVATKWLAENIQGGGRADVIWKRG